MFHRILPATRALVAPLRTTGVRHYGGAFKPETQVALEQRSRISDIPVPAGSWAEYNGKRNSKWNMFLASSIVFFFVTLGATVKGNVWLLHNIGDVKKVKINPT